MSKIMGKEEWLLEDFRQRRAAILAHQREQQRLISFSLLAVGGAGALLGTLALKEHPYTGIVALSIALFLLFLAITYLRYTLVILYNAEYIQKTIRNYLAKTYKYGNLLGWETFFYRKKARMGKRPRFKILFLLREVFRWFPLAVLYVLFLSFGCGTLRFSAGTLPIIVFLLTANLLGLYLLGRLIKEVYTEESLLLKLSTEFDDKLTRN